MSIQDLFSEMWNAGAVSRDWANAIIVKRVMCTMAPTLFNLFFNLVIQS